MVLALARDNLCCVELLDLVVSGEDTEFHRTSVIGVRQMASISSFGRFLIDCCSIASCCRSDDLDSQLFSRVRASSSVQGYSAAQSVSEPNCGDWKMVENVEK